MSRRGEGRPRVVLLGAFVVTTGYGAYLLAPASLLPLLVDTYGIERADAGLAVSAGYLGWLLFQLPSGYLMDRYDNRILVLGAVGLFVAAAVAGLFVPSYAAFLGVRVVGGATGGILFTANANVVGRVFPPERRGVATSTFVASGPAGMALGQFSAPLVADAAAWPLAFVAYGVLAIGGALVFRAGVPDRVRADDRVALAAFGRAVANPTVLLVSVSAFCTNALFLFLNSWMPTYANEVLSIPLAGAGLVAAGVPVAGMLGRPSGGWLSDHLGGRRRPVIVGAIALALPFLGVLPFLAARTTFAAVLVLAGFTLQLGFGVYYAYVPELVDPSVTGTALAALSVFTILGGLVAPALGGWLIDGFGWVVAFATFAVVAVGGIATLFVAPGAQR